MVGLVLVVVWLWATVYAVMFLAYMLCAAIRWTWRLLLSTPAPPTDLEPSKRVPLTGTEIERRRMAWKVSRER